MNYFTVERGGECLENVMLHNADGSVAFENFLNMTYDEMKFSEELSDFVIAIMDATNAKFDSGDDQTIVTLIGEDDIFIWSVIMGPVEDDMINYVTVDWKKDGGNYRYEN